MSTDAPDALATLFETAIVVAIQLLIEARPSDDGRTSRPRQHASAIFKI